MTSARMSRRPVRVLAAATAVLAASAAPAGAAKSKNCPARPNTLKKNSIGRVWHKGGALLACTTVYTHPPKTRRMGRWTPATQVAFDGVDMAWTVRARRDGKVVDRVSAGSADTGRRWLKGRRLVPPSGDAPGRDARIQRLAQSDKSAAWVTQGGDVVLALQSPQDDPEAIGTLPAPLEPAGGRLLVASYPDADAPALGRTLRLVEQDGEGDECGGSNPYRLTIRPEAAASRVGARWIGAWTSTDTAACF